MPLGLSREDLQRIFVDEWHDYVKNQSSMLMSSLSAEYSLEGFTDIQSKFLARKHAQMIAKTEAILTVMNENNLEIERQLKQKGIEV